MRVRTHTNPFNYHERIDPLDLNHHFTDFSGQLDVEVGFGRGIFLRHYAQRHPDRHLLGIEVRKNMVDILNKRLTKQAIQNVHLVHHNGEIVIEDGLGDNSIDNIFVFHPDPWFKKRHHKRRVINPQFLSICQKKLKMKGKLFISTDVASLWEDMQDSCNQQSGFKYCPEDPFWAADYRTHWQEFSEQDKRSHFEACYQKIS